MHKILKLFIDVSKWVSEKLASHDILATNWSIFLLLLNNSFMHFSSRIIMWHHKVISRRLYYSFIFCFHVLSIWFLFAFFKFTQIIDLVLNHSVLLVILVWFWIINLLWRSRFIRIFRVLLRSNRKQVIVYCFFITLFLCSQFNFILERRTLPRVAFICNWFAIFELIYSNLTVFCRCKVWCLVAGLSYFHFSLNICFWYINNWL